MKKVGLAEVAKAANVSPAAVSRALRGSAGLSDSSRKRILRIAQQLNYRSRTPLDSLRKTAIVMPYRPRCAESNYFQQTYSGLSDGLYSAGVVLVHIPLTGSLSDGALARKLKAEHIETAVLLFQAMGQHLADHLEEQGLHTITIGGSEKTEHTTIDFDNISGAERLMEHLSAVGRRRVAFIYAEPDLRHHAERLETYRRARKTMGWDDTPQAEVRTVPTNPIVDAKHAVKQLLEQYPKCDAVFAANDRLAFGVCEGLRELGRKIPEDISVVGYDDVTLAQWFSPALTTVRVPFYRMAVRASEFLRRYYETGAWETEHVVEPTQLIIRESTAPSKIQAGG